MRLVLLIFFIALVGCFDYLSGYEVSFGIFYLVPVAVAGWLLGRRAGLAVALVAALIWMVADHASGHTYLRTFSFYWNGVNRFAVGACAAMASGLLRKRVAEQKQSIFDLRRALLALNEFSVKMPICPICSGFRDDAEYRESLEEFLLTQEDPRAVGEACPRCVEARRLQLAAAGAAALAATDA